MTEPTRLVAADAIPAGTIVVGLDQTEHWRDALDWAVDQAAREHRAISLVHALTPSRSGDSAARSLAGARLLDDARERVGHRAPEMTVHTVLRTGRAVRILHETATRARLLVVGARAHPTLWDRVTGATGGQVARHPSCAVVVVHRHTRRAAARGVLVAVGDSPLSREAVAFAADQAAQRGSPLTVLHVVPLPSVSRAADDDVGARRRLAATISSVRSSFPSVAVRTAVVRGDPVGCILQAGRGMALIVLGAHHPSPADLVLGSTVTPVLQRAACPVAVVP
ncbi:MAG TPA: universal stress protein [Nocardioides sp.]|uniref:universal stress protein n=1 Tax=Nocardioides sp. TaxID=35761 RepID=UPI002BF16754|nr:universal stress protein [Nocardioides sp.]HTW13868.1 universal stress protein [Nocardioides sp.]